MPVHSSKKCTTTHSHDSTEGEAASGLPSQQEFLQHVRELVHGDIRLVLEAVMREELLNIILARTRVTRSSTLRTSSS